MGKGGGEARETADQRAAMEVAAQRWNQYQQFFVPVENQFIDRVGHMQDPAQYAAAQGVSNAAITDELAPMEGQFTAGAIDRGANPNSGMFQSPALAKARMRARGAGATAANSSQTDRAYAARLGLIQMGEGQQAEAMTGMMDLAANSGRMAGQVAQSQLDINQSNLGLIGTVACAGTRGYMGEDPTGGHG